MLTATRRDSSQLCYPDRRGLRVQTFTTMGTAACAVTCCAMGV